MASDDFDLAIVGAGTAGAALAVRAARAGMRVVCVDRRPLDGAGARWVNGVPRWMFDEAGLEQPQGQECVGSGHPFHLVAGRGPTRVVVRKHDVLDVDMRLLVARLQQGAREAGADLRGDVTVHGLEGSALSTSTGTLKARFFVDASGLAGARLLGQDRTPASDLCTAAQEVRVLRDPAGARAFLEQQGVEEGDTLCFTSIAGGFSIVNVRVERDRVSLLTGSIPVGDHPSGARLLASFVAEQPWIGEVVFGGARAIPLRLPGELARGPVALLGDAGSQVFSAHGSGIGVGLVAAKLLADAIARGEGGGPEAYARAFQRRFGLLLRTYDVLRRFSQRIGAREVRWMMRTGLMNETSVRMALEQRLPLAS